VQSLKSYLFSTGKTGIILAITLDDVVRLDRKFETSPLSDQQLFKKKEGAEH
jgi:hypothetical protein